MLSFNRTNMELKQVIATAQQITANSFNRTNMELKHFNPPFEQHLTLPLLIAPIWN